MLEVLQDHHKIRALICLSQAFVTWYSSCDIPTGSKKNAMQTGQMFWQNADF